MYLNGKEGAPLEKHWKVLFRLWQVNVRREIQGGVGRAIRSERKSDKWTDKL